MLKGCSRRELSARRRRQPCLANKFSTGKLRRERGPLRPPAQGKTSLDLKWGASKLCNVTPKTQLPRLQPGAPDGACMAQRHAHKHRVHAPWQALCVPWDLGSGKKSQQPQFRCTPIDPRCPIFQHPLPQNWASLLLKAGAPLCRTGPDLTHMVWPCAPLHPMSRKPGSASLLSASSQFIYDKKWVSGKVLLPCPSWGAGPPEWAAIPWQCPCASPSLETLAGKRASIACS